MGASVWSSFTVTIEGLGKLDAEGVEHSRFRAMCGVCGVEVETPGFLEDAIFDHHMRVHDAATT